jgi:hypothetical protein
MPAAQPYDYETEHPLPSRRRLIGRLRFAAVAIAVIGALALVLVTNAFAANPTNSGGVGIAPASHPTPRQLCLKKTGTAVQNVHLDLFYASGFAKFERSGAQSVALCGNIAGKTFTSLRELEIDGQLQLYNQVTRKWAPVGGSVFFIKDQKDVGRNVMSFQFYWEVHIKTPGSYRVKFHTLLRSDDVAAQKTAWPTLTIG